MFNVVASVDQYQHFVPWCKKSQVMKGRNGDIRAELEIGFPPVVERYTSEVTVIPNHQVRVSLCLGSSRKLKLTQILFHSKHNTKHKHLVSAVIQCF